MDGCTDRQRGSDWLVSWLLGNIIMALFKNSSSSNVLILAKKNGSG